MLINLANNAEFSNRLKVFEVKLINALTMHTTGKEYGAGPFHPYIIIKLQLLS